jgi:hypothetical protein
LPDTITFGYQSAGLIPPALFVESAAVSQHNGAGTLAIEIGANSSAVVGGERDALLRGRRGQDEGERQNAKNRHREII